MDTPSNVVDIVTKQELQETFAGLKVTRTSDTDETGVCFIIYGDPGVGKTTLIGSAQDSSYGAPLLLLNIDAGARALAHRTDIAKIDIRTWRECTNILAELEKSATIPYKTVAWDNLSEIQNLNLASITNGEQPEWKHWNRNTFEMIKFIKRNRDLANKRGINVFFTAWSAFVKDADTGITRIELAFTPSLAAKIPGDVDAIGYLSVENDAPKYTRCLSFEPSRKTRTKFRRSQTEAAMKIPYKIYNPSLVSLLATLKGDEEWPEKLHTPPIKEK